MAFIQTTLPFCYSQPVSASKFLKNPASRPGLALGLILFIALLLRLSNLDATSLWIDEIYSFVVANGHTEATQIDVQIHPAQWFYDRLIAWQPLHWETLVELLKRNVHMPLYYLVLNPWLGFWEKTVGLNDVLALRSLSVLFSVLMIVPLYLLGQALGDSEDAEARKKLGLRTGLLVAFVAAVSPFQLYYAQEGRMYAMGMCWAAWSSLGLWKILYTPPGQKNGGWDGMYPVFLALGVLTHYMFVFFLGFHFVFALIWLRQHWAEEKANGFERCKMLLGALILLILIAIWWYPIYKVQQQGVTEEYHFAKGMVDFTRYLEVFVWQPLMMLSGENKLIRCFYIPATVSLAVAGIWTFVKTKTPLTWRREGFIACWIFVPLLVQVIYDLMKGTHTSVIDRYVMLTAPGMLLWLGWMGSKFWAARHLKKAIVLFLGLAIAAAWAPSPFRDEHNKKDIADKIDTMAFIQLDALSPPQENLIFVNGPYGVPGLAAYYLASRSYGYWQDELKGNTHTAFNGIDKLSFQPMLYWINRYNGKEYPLPDKALFKPYQRVWLFRTRANNERGLQTAKDYLKSMYPNVVKQNDWLIYTR